MKIWILQGLTLVCLIWDGTVWAADDVKVARVQPVPQYENAVWSFALGGRSFRLSGEAQNDLRGFGAQVGFGRGYFIGEGLLLQGQVDIYAGPWARARDSAFDMDYNGSGASVEMLHGIFGPLRSQRLTWAYGLSLSYFDITGRSIGPNRHEIGNPADERNGHLERNYRIKASGMVLMPELVLLETKSPRLVGNTPELLMTRVEGWSVKMGVGLPLFARFRSDTIKPNEAQESSGSLYEKHEKGALKGYFGAVTLQGWLGA